MLSVTSSAQVHRVEIRPGDENKQQAFEMCRVGDFNLSQDSSTLVAALTTLRELPKTNAALYREIRGETEAQVTGNEDDLAEDDDDTPDEYGSDIPVDVIVSHIVSDGLVAIAGFGAVNHRGIARTGAAEDPETVADEPVEGVTAEATPVLGRRHRIKARPGKYGAAWERHWRLLVNVLYIIATHSARWQEKIF